MASNVHFLSHRSTVSTHPHIAGRRPLWFAPIIAIAVLGAACAMPGPDAPPRAPFAASASEPVGAVAAEPPGVPDSQQTSGGHSGTTPTDSEGHVAGAGVDAAEIEPVSSGADGSAPPAPPVSGLSVVMPPVVVPPVPAPPGLIQAPGPPCEPVPGPRAGSWRDPLPPTPRHNPDGPKRVALQAGHWLTEQVPAELRGLQHGATGGGKQEWEVNLDIARRTAALLEAQGIQVDILPATIPVRYRAHVFVSIHADRDAIGRLSGSSTRLQCGRSAL